MSAVGLKTRAWITWHQVQNRFYDTVAVLRGYCNDCPWRPDFRYPGGGYKHWRCGLGHGHSGQHRFINYTWGADGRTSYEPIDGVHVGVQPKWMDRNFIATRRQMREQARSYAEWNRERGYDR